MTPKLTKIAKSLQAAELEYNIAFNEYWNSLNDVCVTSTFDYFNQYFIQIHDEMVKNHAPREIIKATTFELFRRAICKNYGYTIEGAVRYARAFELRKTAIKDKLWNIIKDDGLVGGDDSFEDFLDTFVAFGSSVYQFALNGGYISGSEMMRDIRREAPAYAKYIGRELYIATNLKSAAARAIKNQLVDEM
jgi:hypothetical protein